MPDRGNVRSGAGHAITLLSPASQRHFALALWDASGRTRAAVVIAKAAETSS